MVTGWRRAFCTSIPKEKGTKALSDNQQHCENKTKQSPKISSKFAFFSNPSTPRLLQSQTVLSPSLRCRTSWTATPPSSVPNSPKLKCNISSTPKKNNSSILFQPSNPSSPKSPSSFSLLKSSLRLSKTRCGICLQSVKAGQGTAIFTAECSHTFHFPCVSAHVKTQQVLACPVCSTKWNELSLHSFHHTQNNPQTKPNKPREPSKLGDVKTKPLRIYDDDEPLMSPTSGARFNPIPEYNEEQGSENDDAGFQGFLVNSSTSHFVDKSNKTIINVEVKLLPDAAVVAVGKSFETYAVVLRVKAPCCGDTTSSLLDPASRAPIDLVTVLDVSSGMNGTKLQMMKRAMRLVVSSLCSTDRLSIVAFSATSKRLLPLKRMNTTGRRSARRVIDAIVAVNQGSMCANDAVKKATKVLEDRRERNPAATILLLSDGQDEKKSPSPSVSSTRLPQLEIPVHTIGFRHTPSEDAFIKRVGSLLSMVVQDLRLQLSFVPGSAPAEIAAVYSLTAQPTAFESGSIRIGDLYVEQERDFLVEIKVPSSSIGSRQVLSVRSSHSEPTTQELFYSKEQTILIPRPHAIRSSSPSIERLRNLHVSTRAVAESRRLMKHNDLSNAYNLVSSARALLQRSSFALAEEFVRGLEAELAEINRCRQQQLLSQRQRTSTRERESIVEKAEPLTPTSAWRAAERLAKVAIMRKSMNRVSDLHGFENARF